MAINPGGNLNSVPNVRQQALSTNYLDFTAQATSGWAQQYLPDLMEKEAEVFGQRTISGFLEKVGAEEAMSSDQVIWSEQGRLHLSYYAKMAGGTGGNQSAGDILIQFDIDSAEGSNGGLTTHGIRLHDTVIVANSEAVAKCLVTGISGATIDVAPYGSNATLAACGFTDTSTEKGYTVLVYGSEFKKGVSYFSNDGTGASNTVETSRGANEPQFKTYSNKPIIMKDYYEVSGSDTGRIGWVEITGEEGQNGFLWYLKAEADTRARFNDYLEMSMIEGVRASGNKRC